MGIRFFIYGAIGWCAEVLWTGLGSLMGGDAALRGFSSLWMFPIYGLMVLLEPIHLRIREMPLVFRGGVYTLLIYAGELSSGLLLRRFGVCPWDYPRDGWGYDGLVTLRFIPVWFVFGLIFERIHDMLDKLEIGKKKSVLR